MQSYSNTVLADGEEKYKEKYWTLEENYTIDL